MSAEATSKDQPDSLLSAAVIGVVVAALLLAGVVLVVGQLLPGSNNVKIVLAVAWFVLAGAVLGRVGKSRPGLRVPLRAGVALGAVVLLGWYANSLRGNEVQDQLVDATPVAAAAATAAPSRPAATSQTPRSAARETETKPSREPPARRARARSGASGSATATADDRPARTERPPAPAARAEPEPRAEAAPEAPAKAPPKAAGPGLVASGSFGALEHDTSGRAEIVRTAAGKQQLQLRDFKTDAGPDLKVYLATDTGAGDFVDLGKLKGNSGNQVYGLPGTVDLKKYDTVLIWCRAFTVGFGQAALR